MRDLRAYRPCVGALIVNTSGKVWLGRRFGASAPHNWQFPQGGTDDEPPETALWRELAEEIGLQPSEAIILDRTEQELFYDFPPEVLARKRFDFVGQRQHWFVLEVAREQTFRFDLEDPPEFDAWRWATMHQAVDGVIPFKAALYQAVAGRFRAWWRD